LRTIEEATLKMNVPKILLTTSRNPTARVRTFCNDLVRMLPNALRINRGKMSNEQLAEKALEEGARHIIVVDRGQSGSGAIRFCKIGQSGLLPIPPGLHVAGIRLQRDFGIISRVKPVRAIAILNPVPPDEVKRFATVLADFFSIPLLSVDEATKTATSLMSLQRDADGKVTVSFMAEPGYVEVGPRVTVSKIEWRADT